MNFLVIAIATTLLISPWVVSNNASASIPLESQNKTADLQKESNKILESLSNIVFEYNTIKDSLNKVFDIILLDQSSTTNQLESELPPIPPSPQSSNLTNNNNSTNVSEGRNQTGGGI